MAPAQSAAENTKALQFSQCMRSHGVPNFPDPSTGLVGEQVIDLRLAGIDLSSPTFQAASEAARDRPGRQVRAATIQRQLSVPPTKWFVPGQLKEDVRSVSGRGCGRVPTVEVLDPFVAVPAVERGDDGSRRSPRRLRASRSRRRP